MDSEPLHKRAKELAFQEIGIVLADSVYDSYKGRPDRAMMPEILSAHGRVADAQRVMQRKEELYAEIRRDVLPVAGAVEFVRWAAARYKLGLATSATPETRAATLQMIGIADCFQSIVDTGRSHRAKPDPEIFQVAIGDLGLNPEQCWIVEDSIAGVRAGKTSGSFTVAITTAFDRRTLEDAGADLIIDSFAELKALLHPQ